MRLPTELPEPLPKPFSQRSFARKLHFVTMMFSLILNGLGIRISKPERYCDVCSHQNDLALQDIYTQGVRYWIKSVLIFSENECSFRNYWSQFSWKEQSHLISQGESRAKRNMNETQSFFVCQYWRFKSTACRLYLKRLIFTVISYKNTPYITIISTYNIHNIKLNIPAEYNVKNICYRMLKSRQPQHVIVQSIFYNKLKWRNCDRTFLAYSRHYYYIPLIWLPQASRFKFQDFSRPFPDKKKISLTKLIQNIRSSRGFWPQL